MFSLTMKKATMDTIMFFIFTSQVLPIFGKLTVLRGKEKMICLSEDDGGALVWNYNLIWKPFPHSKRDHLQFRNLNEFNNNEINCKMNTDKGCLESWTKNDWNLTNSLKTPMAPVFDQRWEEFKQYENFGDVYDYINYNFTTDTDVTFSFSVRASRNVHILLCNGKDYKKDSCYWIIIGGWNNTLSVIRKCAMGVPLPGERLAEDSKCMKALDSFQHTPLSKNEWTTFIITWNSAMRSIIVYDIDTIIMTYIDEEKRDEFLKNDYHMFIRSDTAMLFRFHIYDFLHTSVENAVLTSPIFQFNNKVICVQLLIGLCFECDANIVLRDSNNNEVLEMITVKGSSKIAIHGLPIWQSVKVKRNSIDCRHRVIIQLIPKLNEHSSNPLWAIANVRQCPRNGALRKSVMIPNQDWDKQLAYFWLNVTCQKLFYDEHAVVNPLSRVKPDINLNNATCPQGKIGPQCLFSCEYDLNSNSACKGTKICYEKGCTCAPGFLGDWCSKPCESNTYGHNCKETCGSCLYETLSKKRCDEVTGMCSNGCNNTKEIYIPPLCQTNIDKPSTPVITFISKTTIWSFVSMTWKDEYDKISIFYSFAIKTQITYYVQQSMNRLFRNMTHLIGYFDNLEPGSTYKIRCSLRIADVQIHSDWKTAETECIPAENFDVTPEKNGIIINWRINPNQTYSCPAKWYFLVIRNINTNETVVSELAMSFPYKLQHLPSYTSFNVTIFREDQVLFSKDIRTLEGVPSKVLDLHSLLILIILFLVVAVAAFYLYTRKRQRGIEQLVQDEMALSQNTETDEHKTKSVISNLKEDQSTFSDIPLSQATTSEGPSIVITNNKEEEKEISLVTVKDFENYVRH
ncbi:uncharacterized protein [Temnothorax nylanderi]|uniref:uncharacterized protein n=1 Tax=Temnothorax nylanderi TaxID=102681 RepID=UPI003A84FC34